MSSTYDKGIKKELKAINYLKAQKYKILHHRYRSRYGEIDIIATKGDVVIAVEVKLRQSFFDARTCITRRQMQRIEEGLLDFISKDIAYKNHSLRMDVILFVGNEQVHIENAWV
ncbi:MAG: YraN family protein [Alphaproteobacteria bacterium]|nr:MAG: YraN family protein [Alphaproteobacteria bacterium]